jgi:hypothetical protein
VRRAAPLTAIILALAIPASASARSGFASTITIHWTQDGSDSIFYGLVSSEKRGCKANRHVKVVYSADNTSYAPYDTAVTNSDGTWAAVSPTAFGGWYRAIAQRRHLASGTCHKAMTEPFSLM